MEKLLSIKETLTSLNLNEKYLNFGSFNEAQKFNLKFLTKAPLSQFFSIFIICCHFQSLNVPSLIFHFTLSTRYFKQNCSFTKTCTYKSVKL